jgi:hypothetical protein
MVCDLKAWPVFFGLGIIGLFGSLILAIPGIGYISGIGPEDYTEEEKYEAGLNILGICTPIVLIPSLLFFLIGFRGYRKNKRARDVADILRLYRSMHISELAERLGKSRPETETIVFDCVNDGLIQGYIDPGSKRFIVTEPPQPVPQPIPGPVMAYPNMPPPPPIPPPIPPPMPPPHSTLSTPSTHYPPPPGPTPSTQPVQVQKKRKKQTEPEIKPPDRLRPSNKM